MSVPDSDMLLSISEVLETPVSTLLGETVALSKVDDLKAISEKLEVINLQLAQRKTVRRNMLHWLLVSVSMVVITIFAVLIALNSPYLGWIMVILKLLFSEQPFTYLNGCLSGWRR